MRGFSHLKFFGLSCHGGHQVWLGCIRVVICTNEGFLVFTEQQVGFLRFDVIKDFEIEIKLQYIETKNLEK